MCLKNIAPTVAVEPSGHLHGIDNGSIVARTALDQQIGVLPGEVAESSETGISAHIAAATPVGADRRGHRRQSDTSRVQARPPPVTVH